MKILLLGDASNFHNALALGLRKLGCEVTVASSGSVFMNTRRDIDLRRPLPGPAGGALLWLKLMGATGRRLCGFDIVSCTSPCFVDLRPQRIAPLFRRLRRHNGRIFYTALGTDIPFIEECLDPASLLRYNELRFPDGPGPLLQAQPDFLSRWNHPALRAWTEEFYRSIDGAVSALYEYHLSLRRRLPADRIAYGGIPIDVDSITPVTIPDIPRPIEIFLGRHAARKALKGTDRLETAIRRAMAARPGAARLTIVENRPYDEYLTLMRSAHLVVDQAYSYTPATNALLAMAHGIPVVSGAEPPFYHFLNDVEQPIINSPIDVDSMTTLFIHILDNPAMLAPLGAASRRFVLRHNAATTVARRFLTFWQRP